MKKRKTKCSLWIPNINYDANKITMQKFQQKYYQSIKELIIKTNNTQRHAKAACNIIKLFKKTPFIEGSTNENNEKISRCDTDNCFEEDMKK